MTEAGQTQVEKVFREMADKWPSTVVARSQVKSFSGGVLDPRYLANLDSTGEGPSIRLRIGRQIVYPVNELVSWMIARAEVLNRGPSGGRVGVAK